MIVVSDTSPIRALGHLGRLDVLPVLFRQVLIPPAVQYELENPPNRFSPIGVSEVGWIQVEEITAVDRVNTLLQTLDSGESEALALALERRAEAILIDEAAGRSVATELSLTPSER